jgi:GNAT superfamily N-acetyltransferase
MERMAILSAAKASVPSNTSWPAKSTALYSSLRLFRVIGYAVLCFGYSVELGGRGVFVDDFYIIASERGQGLAHSAMDVLIGFAREAGCVAMHLEVVAGNRAENFYRRLGFRDRGSALLTLRPLGEHK